MSPDSSTSRLQQIVGTIDDPLIMNETGAPVRVLTGRSTISAKELLSLPGFYEVYTRPLPKNAVFVPLVKIAKETGYRLVAQVATKTLREYGLSLPPIQKGLPGLDLKGTILSTVGAWAACTSSTPGLAILDLANAYARIHAPASNIFSTTSDNQVFRLTQPVQGLAIAGTLAPSLMHQWFKRQTRKCRRSLEKKHKEPIYLHSSSYSDNVVIVSSRIEEVLDWFLTQHKELINRQQTQVITRNPVRTLGFRWSVSSTNTLTIRRPARTNKEQVAHYDHVIGRQPLLRILSNLPIQHYCDGVSSEGSAISAAGIFQDNRLILGTVKRRQGIDQLLSEATAIRLSNQLRSRSSRLQDTIFTDSEILTKIADHELPRDTIERAIIRDISQIKFVPGDNNLADPLTREDHLIKKFEVRRPKRVLSPRTTPTRSTTPRHKRVRLPSEPEDQSPSDNPLSSESEASNTHQENVH